MNLKDIRKMKRAIQPRPVDDISNLLSLRDNFVYSLLINTRYKEEIEGFSPVEMGNWLKQNELYSDYDLLELIVEDNNSYEEVQDGE